MMFDRAYMEKELEKLGAKLSKRITVYLIGGGCMMYRDTKAATKDVDMVVTDTDDLLELTSSLIKMGYLKIKDLPDDYKKGGATVVLKNRDSFQYDIFYKQVCNGLTITDEMKDRAEFMGELNDLVVFLISPEDIFLLKSITEREADLEDMMTLVESGLDWSIIWNECKKQKGKKIWEAFFLLKLDELKKRYGIDVPIYDKVRREVGDILIERKILDFMGEGKTFTEIAEHISKTLNYSNSWTRKELNKMLERGVLDREKQGRSYCYVVNR